MTTIQCPICGSFLVGDGERELTIILRAHLSSAHDLRAGSDVPSSVEMREHRPQLWEEMKRGAVPVDREMGEVGEDIEVSVLCPFCGDRLYGHDGEDLTQHLIAHFHDAHGVRTPGRSLTRAL